MDLLGRLVESFLYSLVMLLSPACWIPALVLIGLLRYSLDPYEIPWIAVMLIIVGLSWFYFGISYLTNETIKKHRRGVSTR